MTARPLDGKIAFLTGGGSGIGRATALMLAKAGARVAVADISTAGGAETVSLIGAQGGEAIAIAVDAADEDAIAAALQEAAGRFGGLHLALNNIGGGETGKTIVTTEKARWDDIIARNLTATWLAMKHEIPLIEASGGGAIVNMASMAGVSPMTDASPAYASAKAGVIHLTRYAAKAHADDGIRVNAIAPGLTRTPLVKQHLTDADVSRIVAESQFIRRACEPEEIAATALFLFSPQAAMITGTTIPVTGGVP
ncbi:SDR family oxidoreductase [Sphingomonas sp. CGMCC 1.13654]|uniref:SDR family oxidoreductase n=1 Tax=Sphingomonas chungangi TaxID=2683589 RepID=A0A838L3M4_9SPHN|nr:SDR family oxidoreductase [Sphingomonas chungangi]